MYNGFQSDRDDVRMKQRSLYYFLVVLLGHLLLALSMMTTFVFAFKSEIPESEAQKGTVVPAYVSPDPMLTQPEQEPAPLDSSASAMSSAASTAASEVTPTETTTTHEVSTAGLLKPSSHTIATESKIAENKPKKSSKAVSIPNLISEKEIDKPLLKILSHAMKERLTYPKSASDFHVTGKVLVRFLLFPSGIVSDVSIVQSSGSGVLDQAALTTVATMRQVPEVGEYLKESQFLVVGIIYGE